MFTNKPDSEAYRRMAVAYAHACDHGDGAALLALFAPGGALVGPRSTRTGEKIAEVPSLLRTQFARTRHEVLNQTLTQDADGALRGETYCNAQHLYLPEKEANTILVWAVRYEDELARAGDDLRLLKRTVHVEWQEKRAVFPPA